MSTETARRKKPAPLTAVFGPTPTAAPVAPAIKVPKIDKPQVNDEPETPKNGSSSGRAGQVPMPFWVPKACHKQLRLMAVEEDTTQQALMREALNMLFRKRGRPEIA